MQASDRQSDLLLEMKNITKEFPGVKALDGVSLRVRRGSVHALMGENGAGKSTLMKCLFGIYARDGGEILLEGNPVFFRNPREALENGVAMVHQELNQALKRSVMDNIWLGRYPTALGVYTLEKKMYEDTKRIFQELDIEIIRSFPIGRDRSYMDVKLPNLLANACIFEIRDKKK